MSVHREISFEEEVSEYLANNGWLYALADAALYDRARATLASDVSIWVNGLVTVWFRLLAFHYATKEQIVCKLRPQQVLRAEVA